MKKNNISIVIINWNGKDHTLKLLESIKKLNYESKCLEIICVDNGSDDGSVDAIKKFYNNLEKNKWRGLRLISFKKNMGVTKAYNAGYKKAKNFEYLWKLDNDLILEKNSLNKLVEKFEQNKQVGIVGSAVFPLYSYTNLKENYKGKAEIGCKIDFLTTGVFKKEMSYKELKSIKNNIYQDITYSIGCSNLIKKKVLDKIGFLDEDFFLYYDDSYFSYKTKKAGFKLITATDSIVFHKGSASTGGIMKPLGIYFTTLSELLFFRKTIKMPLFIIYYPFIFIKRFILTIYRLIVQKDIKMLFEGIGKFFSANFKFLFL